MRLLSNPRGMVAATVVLWALGGAPRGHAQAIDWTEAPVPGSPLPFEAPGVERLRLSNGIPLLVVSRGEIPLVQVTVVVRRGSSDDPPGRAGLASLTASSLLGGAGDRSAAELANREASLGLDIVATATRHGIQVGTSAPPAVLDDVLDLLADIVLRPRFEGTHVERTLERRRSLFSFLASSPLEVANLLWRQAAYSARHPYGRLVEGTPSQLDAIATEDVRRFHGAAAEAPNIFIVVVGPVAATEIRQAVESRFGNWTGHVDADDITRASVPDPRTRPGLYLVHWPGATQAIVRLAHSVPASAAGDEPVLQVLNMVLGGSTTSRIGIRLRDERGVTYEARTEVELDRQGGHWVGWSNVSPEVAPEVVATFLDEIRRVRRLGATESEVAEAKVHLLLSYPASFMTVRGTAAMVVEELLERPSAAAIGAWTRGIEAVTASDVHRAANEYLRPHGAAVVVVGDTTALAAKLREMGLGPTTVATVDDILELRAVPD